ncbi:MAG: PAS domain-containing sensor histidine kinase [Acidobacteria bacterium]|nr:PAS domain-containing sensor histidine kinase [Acidobacteriota bacterium]
MAEARVKWLFDLPSHLLLETPPWRVLPVALSMAVVIAALDYSVRSNLSLGLLYAFPIVLSALVLSRPQILLASLVCALLREHFAPFGWEAHALLRIVSAFATFAGTGLFVGELVRSRRMALAHSRAMQQQHERRIEAENQVRMLVESSPAAIVTLDPSGRVELANQAAHELFSVPSGDLPGQSIGHFLPTVARLLLAADNQLPYRSATNCRGSRANGETFLACVWFATYPTAAGRRMAAIITDNSEDLRDWQESSLQSLLRSSRVLMGSVSHEIRNICAAIAVVHTNLGRLPGVGQTEDYSALGTLAQALTRLTTVELQSISDQPTERVNLEQLLDEFRIVVSPSLDADEVELRLLEFAGLPPVQGDRHGLLQVLLNLSRNSVRALDGCASKQITIQPQVNNGFITIRFSDSGPGVVDPASLFQPFQPGAKSVGLGLFVSRAIVRACGGELYFEPSLRGCTICMRLLPFASIDHQTEERSTEIPA